MVFAFPTAFLAPPFAFTFFAAFFGIVNYGGGTREQQLTGKSRPIDEEGQAEYRSIPGPIEKT